MSDRKMNRSLLTERVFLSDVLHFLSHLISAAENGQRTPANPVSDEKTAERASRHLRGKNNTRLYV
jgi:hypothetical protein